MDRNRDDGTVAHTLFGLRVVRLNGQPLVLLMSLERAGGYAARFATRPTATAAPSGSCQPTIGVLRIRPR